MEKRRDRKGYAEESGQKVMYSHGHNDVPPPGIQGQLPPER